MRASTMAQECHECLFSGYKVECFLHITYRQVQSMFQDREGVAPKLS